MHMKIDDTRPRIFYLEPEDAVLSEIVVEADFVTELLENTFEKIPENYPDDDSRYKGFYRQTLYKHDTIVYMGEAFIDSYKSSYNRSVMDSQIEILRFRKFTGVSNYEDRIHNYKYRALNIHQENIFFKDRLKPSVSIGVRFHPFGAF